MSLAKVILCSWEAIYYRNVFIFKERIKDVAKVKAEQAVRLNLHTCLQGTALEWYSWKLTQFEKHFLRELSLEHGWITLLIKHFKEGFSTSRN
jgi:hypothetical protein